VIPQENFRGRGIAQLCIECEEPKKEQKTLRGGENREGGEIGTDNLNGKNIKI